MRLFVVALLAFVFLVASNAGGRTGAPVRSWPSAAARTLEAGKAPTPYTAAQIRAGCPDGLRTRYLLDQRQGKMIQGFAFENGDEEAVDFEVVMETEDGRTVGAHPARRVTWAQLQGHASFAADETAIEDETITVPTGTYECMRYTITKTAQDVTTVATFWFAYDLPGPPIRWEETVGGRLRASRVLLERKVVE